MAECLRRLKDLLGEFPFVGMADEANAYGLLVGQLLKSAYPSPIGFIDKPASQTGATKLATTIAALADGRLPAIMTASERAEENDKRLSTHLARGPASLLVDNLNSKFASDVIASGMTADSIGGRLLGVNAEAKVPTRSLQIYMTGNNASLERDLINRSISVRLDSGVENPEERTGFRYDLPSAALERRPHFFSAAISLVARWVEVGCPMGGGAVLDSYKDWMHAVGGILDFAGVPGFNENRPDFKRRADTEGDREASFVERWFERAGHDRQSPADLLDSADGVFNLNGVTEAAKAQSLGHRLSKMADRIFMVGDSRLTVRRDRGRSSTYSLELLEG